MVDGFATNRLTNLFPGHVIILVFIADEATRFLHWEHSEFDLFPLLLARLG